LGDRKGIRPVKDLCHLLLRLSLEKKFREETEDEPSNSGLFTWKMVIETEMMIDDS